MESDIKLQNGLVELTGDKVRADVGFAGGTVELNGSNFKTSVTDLEMLYYGGRLRAKGGDVELGSGDSGTFKGFSQFKNGTVQVAGDTMKVEAGTVEIGSRSSGKFKGLNLSHSVMKCSTSALMVINPDVQPSDRQQRIALAQNADDELLINDRGHYKGGVRLDGPVRVTGDLSVQTTLQMHVGSKLQFLTPDHVKILSGGKKIRMPGLPIDVLDTIQNLQAMIKELQEKVAALEAK
jgi:hypothetical protein